MFKSVASRLIFWIAGTTGVLFTVATAYSYVVSRDLAIRDAQRRAILTAEAQANAVVEVLHSVEEGARLLASTLGHTSASNEELEQVIRSFVEGNPRVYGSTVATRSTTWVLVAEATSVSVHHWRAWRRASSLRVCSLERGTSLYAKTIAPCTHPASSYADSSVFPSTSKRRSQFVVVLGRRPSFARRDGQSAPSIHPLSSIQLSAIQ